MPVIRIQRKELERLGVSVDELVENVRMLGADLKDASGEEILVEFFPDRPDLYSVEGVVRAIKQYLGRGEKKKYAVNDGAERIVVEPNVKDVRPYIVAAVVRNVNVDELMIKSMMDFQEKLHITVGRKRKKVAIGLHDYDKVKGPFTYTTKDENFSFVPLGFEHEMTLKEILEKHPKGVEYGNILINKEKYPIILDSEGNVVSFPPVINGVLTQITPNTKNIFIDMTGTDLNTLLSALNIVVCAFIDRGAEVEKVNIDYGDLKIDTPELKYYEMDVNIDYARKILGFEISEEEIIKALEKMGYFSISKGHSLKVTVPPYRQDILHEIDIVEDIAKGYSYDNIPLSKLNKYRRGRGMRWEEIPRLSMIGLGFVEVKTLTLVSMSAEYDLMQLNREPSVVVSNPVSEGTETLRTWLIPSLMEILKKNKHRDLPQKIFETGYVRGSSLERHLAFLIVASRVGFTDIKSIVERVLGDMGITDYLVTSSEHPSFIPGRCANIVVKSEKIGFFGEIHPEVLEKFDIGYPVVGAEINIEKVEKFRE